MTVALLLDNAAVAAMDDGRPGPAVGLAQRQLGMVADGALAIDDGRLLRVGPRDEVRAAVEGQGGADEVVDLGGRLVLPGLVDPHTHLVWGGSRVEEFARRAAGASYLEIAAEGGGIMSTVRATRAASATELLGALMARLDVVLQHGVTCVEIKSGYGLELEVELRQLEVIAEAAARHPVRVAMTFLGAHAVPAEHADDRTGYVRRVVEEMIPAVAERYPEAFCDVFCDAGAFDLDEATQILRAAHAAGLPLKAHVDEFERLGLTPVAAALGATSCDHLMRATDADRRALAQHGTVAVLLPGTTVGLGATSFADGRAMIDDGVPVALATDWNPGSAPCSSLPLVLALASRYCGMTPAECLVAVTRNAACAIGMDDSCGRLAEGRPADLVVTDTDDPRDLAYRFGANPILEVMISGRWWPVPASGPRSATG